MRRRFFWGLAAATAALAILAGSGTYGFFSSTTINPGNSFFAGRLVLANDRNGTFILTASNMQPGDRVIRHVTLAKDPTSSLDMNYTLQRTDKVLSDTATPAPSADLDMCHKLAIVVKRLDAGQPSNVDDPASSITAGALISSVTGDSLETFATAAIDVGALNNSGNSQDTYRFDVTFVDTGSAQDYLQGDGCTVEYTWLAMQQTAPVIPTGANEDITVSP